MAGRISNSAKEWIDPYMQQVATIQTEASQKIAKVTALAVEQRFLQLQSPGQAMGGNTLGGNSGTSSKRGGTPAQHRKAGKAGGQARARKLNNTTNTNGTAGETSALT